MDDIRCQALSRARGIANEPVAAYGRRYQLQGVAAGDVLDWPDTGLFLAVISAEPAGLHTHGVSQTTPWEAVRDIRMGAYPLYLRLQTGQIVKVAVLRR